MNPPTPHDIDCFCRAHWLRLYAAARHRVHDEQEAQDAVQEVFMTLVQQNKLILIVQLSEPERQIAILVTRLNWLLKNRWRNQHRQRRGGGMCMVSLQDDASTHLELADHQTPVRILATAWAHEVIEAALTGLRSEMSDTDWKALEPRAVSRHLQQPQAAIRILPRRCASRSSATSKSHHPTSS